MGQKAPSAKRCIKTRPQPPVPEPRLRHVRKHRAPKGALRRGELPDATRAPRVCQKAPSAKRCIKTGWLHAPDGHYRCQKAPSAKRCIKTIKSPPGGIFRLAVSQKAPSAKRCIKTATTRIRPRVTARVRKHRAPKGALRLVCAGDNLAGISQSESTERQKVH